MFIDKVKDMKSFYNKLEGSLNYIINKYRNYNDLSDDKKESVLRNLAEDLDKISNLLDNYGYTYRPAKRLDVNNKSFGVLLVRYLNGFQDYIDKGTLEVETIATDIRTLINLIDKHISVKENFI